MCLWTGTGPVDLSAGRGFEPLLSLTVSWGRPAVTNFSAMHSGRAHVIDVNSPPGAPPTTLAYVPLTIGGTRVYWAHQDLAAGGGPQEILTASKDGYVLLLGANTALGRPPMERAFGHILHRM